MIFYFLLVVKSRAYQEVFLRTLRLGFRTSWGFQIFTGCGHPRGCTLTLYSLSTTVENYIRPRTFPEIKLRSIKNLLGIFHPTVTLFLQHHRTAKNPINFRNRNDIQISTTKKNRKRYNDVSCVMCFLRALGIQFRHHFYRQSKTPSGQRTNDGKWSRAQGTTQFSNALPELQQ